MKNDDFAEIKKKMEECLEDVRLRAEFTFEETWRDMQRDPILCAMVHPELLRHAKKLIKHGFLTGAQSGVMILLEKIAQDICE